VYRGSSVSIVSATDWTTEQSRFDPRQRLRIFPLASGVHATSCLLDTGGPFPRGKAQPGRDTDHSALSSDGVVNE
jgi:hypothetical protein